MTCEDIVPTEQYPHISRSQIFYKKGEKLSFRKDQINTPTLESLFNKLQTWNSIKKGSSTSVFL